MRYGLDLGLVWAPPRAAATLGLEYRCVSSFAYRTFTHVDAYTFLERGLGDNFADYDRLTASVELSPPLRGLSLTPTFLVQRQGEGGIRDPFPADYTDFRASPSLFLGVRETTYRTAIRGRYQPLRQVWLSWDLGPNFVRNKSHVIGASTTEFEGTAEIGVRVDFPRGRR